MQVLSKNIKCRLSQKAGLTDTTTWGIFQKVVTLKTFNKTALQLIMPMKQFSY